MNKFYLNEFVYFNGEYDITFNILDINTEKMITTLAVSNQGKISLLEFDLKRDKNDSLYFEYGCEYTKIKLNDFENKGE